MIKLDDVTLRVRRMNGRNGAFCIGDLSSEEGEFKVKDPLLDQFDDGEYTATVWITEIYLAQYVAWGKGVTEIRARLHDLQVDGYTHGAEETQSMEPDPVDEPPAPVAPVTGPTDSPTPSRSQAATSTTSNIEVRGVTPSSQIDAQQQMLFGEIWEEVAARDPVKLDPTVDRLLLRQQAGALKSLGYRFNPREQTWYPG